MHCGSKEGEVENLTAFLHPRSGRKYSHTNSYIFVMTLFSQDYQLTAGAWITCEPGSEINELFHRTEFPLNFIRSQVLRNFHKTLGKVPSVYLKTLLRVT